MRVEIVFVGAPKGGNHKNKTSRRRRKIENCHLEAERVKPGSNEAQKKTIFPETEEQFARLGGGNFGGTLTHTKGVIVSHTQDA